MVFQWSYVRCEWVICTDSDTVHEVLENAWYRWSSNDWDLKMALTYYRIECPD